MSKCNISSNLNASHCARPEGSNVAGRRAGRWNQSRQLRQCTSDPGCSVLQVGLHCTVGQSPKGMMVFIYIGHLSGLQGVKMCAGLLQSVPMGAAECVQGYRVCAGCSFNILPCSSRLNQKIFYWKKNILSECVLKTKIIWKIDYFEDSI